MNVNGSFLRAYTTWRIMQYNYYYRYALLHSSVVLSLCENNRLSWKKKHRCEEFCLYNTTCPIRLYGNVEYVLMFYDVSNSRRTGSECILNFLKKKRPVLVDLCSFFFIPKQQEYHNRIIRTCRLHNYPYIVYERMFVCTVYRFSGSCWYI